MAPAPDNGAMNAETTPRLGTAAGGVPGHRGGAAPVIAPAVITDPNLD